MIVRRSEAADAERIRILADEKTKSVFGVVNVSHLLEHSCLAISVFDESNQLIAAALFSDEVEQELEKNPPEIFGSAVSPLNALFLRYFVSNCDCREEALRQVIETLFMVTDHLFFLFLVSANCSEDFVLLNIFNPFCDDENVRVTKRSEHAALLHIREARVQDHDDLMPIFEQQGEVLQERYGEFYLAEVIEAQDDNHKCLVAEVNGVAIGFMSLSSDVDVDILKENFELLPFLEQQKYFTGEGEEEMCKSSRTESSASAQGCSPVRLTRRSVTDVSDRDDDGESLGGTSRTNSRASSSSSCRWTGNVSSSRHCRSSGQSRLSSGKSSRKSTRKSSNDELNTLSAFSIQLFCIDPQYENRSIDFIDEAFKVFPVCNFCLLTSPYHLPELRLLQSFQRVSPQSTSVLSQQLYLFHRAALLRGISVRIAREKDREEVSTHLQHLKLSKMILHDFDLYSKYRRDEEGNPLQCFVALCESQVVGISILCPEDDIEYVRSHYDIDEFVHFSQHNRFGHFRLLHFVLNPIFRLYTKFFIKEIFRLGRSSAMYYHLKWSPQYAESQSLATCLPDLVPICPRRQIDYDLEVLGHNAPIDDILKKEDSYALLHINKKLLLEPKIGINARIVVVGLSQTSLSFLENLLFHPHLQFNNVSLLSPNGLTSSSLTSKLLGLEERKPGPEMWTWVNVVKAALVGIDRKRNLVELDNGYALPYDKLILGTGTQYSLPKEYQGLRKAKNVYFVGIEDDNIRAFEWLNHLTNSDHDDLSGKIVIYGGSLDTLGLLNSLMEGGVNPKSLVVLVPPSPSMNVEVLQTICQELDAIGVMIVTRVDIVDVSMRGEQLDQLKLSGCYRSSHVNETLDCIAFFPLIKKSVDPLMVKAVNESCIVFDSRIVVDFAFETNDCGILAAGPVSKFQRSDRADGSIDMLGVGSWQLGKLLSEFILAEFDPTVSPDDLQVSPSASRELPDFCDPICGKRRLPGGYNYFSMDPSYSATLLSQKVQRKIKTTDRSNGFFHLEFDEFDSVRSLLCFTKQKFSSSNLACLYGLHQSFLNNIYQRDDDGLITDLFEYFQESWCVALFHDRFPDLRKELRIMHKSHQESPTNRESQQKSCKSEDMRKLVYGFLSYNKNHLPMYARPGMA